MKIYRKFKLVAIALSMVMLFTVTPIRAFAAEVDEGQTVEPRATYTDSVSWYTGKTSTTVQLSHNLTTSSYKKYTSSLAYGGSAVLVLRFTNQSTGNSYTLSFICDETYRVEHPGVMIPLGNYTVTQASFPSTASLYSFACNFTY
jgi:hypothetical protein